MRKLAPKKRNKKHEDAYGHIYQGPTAKGGPILLSLGQRRIQESTNPLFILITSWILMVNSTKRKEDKRKEDKKK